MKSLQGWKALSRRRGAVSEWHSIPAQFHSFKTVGDILNNAGAVSVWWLRRLFFGGFCVLLFLGFGCFVWLALHYPRFASESWVLCHADALF